MTDNLPFLLWWGLGVVAFCILWWLLLRGGRNPSREGRWLMKHHFLAGYAGFDDEVRCIHCGAEPAYRPFLDGDCPGPSKKEDRTVP